MFGLRYFVAAPFIFHKAPWGFSYGKFEIVSFTEDMKEIYNIMSVYAGDPDSFSQEQNYNIGIIFFQRNENKINIMLRNDIWYLGFYADLEKDKKGNYKIINLPEYAYMHD